MLIIGAFVGLMLFYKYVYDGTDYIQSSVDGKSYKVRNSKGKEQKANLLGIMNTKLNLIVDSLKNSNYSSNASVQRLIRNWNRGVTIKEIGKMESDAAYVINKQFMSFCLPDTTSSSGNETADINLMTYVGIHELSHIMSNETGHGNEFIQNFEFLLNQAKKLEYFDPLLQKTLPVYIQLNKLNTADNYCGVPLINSIN